MPSVMSLVFGFLVVLVIGILVVYGVMIYNSLIRLRRNIDKAWSNIDVLLKQRRDEIPKLIDTVEEYMEYEEGVLKDITEKRTEAEKAQGPSEKADKETDLGGALGNLFAVAEDYPELKANEEFKQLQNRISSIEEQIADRREFYNNSVNTFNIRINQIPYNFVSNMIGYTEKELFEATNQEKKDIDIESQFSN